MSPIRSPALPLALAGLLALAACSAGRRGATAEPPAERVAPKTFADEWAVRIAGTPQGDATGILTVVAGDDGALTGTIATDEGTLELSTATATAEQLTVSFYYPPANTNVDIRLTGAPSADELSGLTLGQFATTAVRQ